ncbi:recombinase family protein [Mesorhizobium sp. M0622]|uniref:recombinase family protein n=1 Tax=unclassified Mesorhizobium TaxID=325217 RepID=UPI00333B66F4
MEDGRKRVVRDSIRRNWKDWEVLIRDHHEAYISWEEFERNQHLIANNANEEAGEPFPMGKTIADVFGQL